MTPVVWDGKSPLKPGTLYIIDRSKPDLLEKAFADMPEFLEKIKSTPISQSGVAEEKRDVVWKVVRITGDPPSGLNSPQLAGACGNWYANTSYYFEGYKVYFEMLTRNPSGVSGTKFHVHMVWLTSPVLYYYSNTVTGTGSSIEQSFYDEDCFNGDYHYNEWAEVRLNGVQQCSHGQYLPDCP